MRDRTDALSREEIAFFGRVTAGISHELKNIMATISETASLLVDLLEFWEKGGKLEKDELRSCSEAIMEEIQRGFVTIKHMNKFAHSVDEPLTEVDVNSVLELVSSLWQYMNPGKKVSLDSSRATGLKVLTSPFLLQDLFYQILVSAFETVEPGEEIRISLDSDDKHVQIDFSGIDAVGAGSFLNEKGKVIAAAIRAEVLPSPSGGGVRILLPSEIGGV
jgi:C4-dicarboxylate-specific signal transduction histidine kinase